MTLNLAFVDKMCPNMAPFHQIFFPNMAREKRHAGRTLLPFLGPSTPTPQGQLLELPLPRSFWGTIFVSISLALSEESMLCCYSHQLRLI